MPDLLKNSRLLIVALPVALLAACGDDTVEEPRLTLPAAAADTAASRYLREYVYLGSRGGSPLVVPFSFRSVEHGDSIARSARAQLAHGATWDSFLDESWSTLRESGVWRVLPIGDLRLAVGGPAEVEALWYQRGERSLRLQLEQPLSGWHQANAARYRLLRGQLALGPERTTGMILESLQVQPAGRVPRDSDLLFLTAGDSLALVLGETLSREGSAGRGFAWSWTRRSEQGWGRAEVRWLELRAFEEARRDIPLHWSFRVPEAAIHGEVSALGMEARVGAERPGRRAVEIRYTVEGWVEIGEARSPVVGVITHIQE
jgi:hypothetical protein